MKDKEYEEAKRLADQASGIRSLITAAIIKDGEGVDLRKLCALYPNIQKEVTRRRCQENSTNMSTKKACD